jgi:hypothetical protein
MRDNAVPTLVVIGGFAGTGKTYHSQRLSTELRIPRLSSDAIGQTISRSRFFDASNNAIALAYDVVFGLCNDFCDVVSQRCSTSTWPGNFSGNILMLCGNSIRMCAAFRSSYEHHGIFALGVSGGVMQPIQTHRLHRKYLQPHSTYWMGGRF